MTGLQLFESTADGSISPNADDVSLAIYGEAKAGLVCGWRRGCSTLLSGDPRRWNTHGCCAVFKKSGKQISEDRLPYLLTKNRQGRPIPEKFASSWI